MKKIIDTYERLYSYSEDVLNKSRSKSKKNNEEKVLYFLQNKELEEYSKVLNELSDSEYLKFIEYAALCGLSEGESSTRGLATITRLLLHSYDDKTLINMRLLHLTTLMPRNNNDKNVNDFVDVYNKNHQKCMKFFNDINGELDGSEVDNDEFKKLKFDINYVFGIGKEAYEDIYNDFTNDLFLSNLENSIINMLILEEDEILNNKLKISLFINYIRSLMLCLDEKIIKEFVDKLPNNDDCFQINLVLKTLKIYNTDRNMYLGKGKVLK